MAEADNLRGACRARSRQRRKARLACSIWNQLKFSTLTLSIQKSLSACMPPKKQQAASQSQPASQDLSWRRRQSQKLRMVIFRQTIQVGGSRSSLSVRSISPKNFRQTIQVEGGRSSLSAVGRAFRSEASRQKIPGRPFKSQTVAQAFRSEASRQTNRLNRQSDHSVQNSSNHTISKFRPETSRGRPTKQIAKNGRHVPPKKGRAFPHITAIQIKNCHSSQGKAET